MNPSERNHTFGDNPLVMIDVLDKTWNKAATEFMDDDDLGEVLSMAIRMMAGETPEAAKVAPLCVKLEAYALKYRTQYVMYMGPLKSTDAANMKKNLAKELYGGIDNLVSSLKYLIR